MDTTGIETTGQNGIFLPIYPAVSGALLIVLVSAGGKCA